MSWFEEYREEKMKEMELTREVEKLPVYIKYHADIDKIEKIVKGDWIDLRASKDMSIKEGEFKLVPLGISMKLPEGYEAHLAPRSSTFKNYGIIQVNSVGVIDSSYCGNDDQWMMPVYATRDTIIRKNDRVCQFRIIEIQPQIRFVEVDDLGDESRGGFGSTGVN